MCFKNGLQAHLETRGRSRAVPPRRSNILIADAVFLVYFVLTASAIWCSTTEGNRQYRELFNSPLLVKLYNKYIICFLSAGLFLQCVYIVSEFEAVNYW